jgi:spore maturation protein CgeB
MLERYQRAKISVSFLMGESGSRPYRQVKARAFEIPATGAFQLAYNCPELERFFKIGDEVDVFDSADEMLEKIEFYLKHDALRERMARKAQQRNLNYSYEQILGRVFKEIGL